MPPKSARMSASLVRKVIKEGRSARAEGLRARYVSSEGVGVAVVVSKKVASLAVERNRLRRAAYRGLPRPLPKARVVLFVLSPTFDPLEVAKLCSQLS